MTSSLSLLVVIALTGLMTVSGSLQAVADMRTIDISPQTRNLHMPRHASPSNDPLVYVSRKRPSERHRAAAPRSSSPASLSSANEHPAPPAPSAQSTALRAITLAWDPVSTADLAGYRLYVGTQSGDYETSVDIGPASAYRYQGLQPGVTYFFAVSAYDRNGLESSKSNEVAYTASAASPVRCGFLGRKFVCGN